MKRAYSGWLLVAAAFGGSWAQAAEMPAREWGLLFGGGWADEDLVGGEDDVQPLLGLRYGQRLDERFNFFGDLVFGRYDSDLPGVGDADVTTLRGGLEWLFSRRQRFNWFLSGGLGLMNVNTDGSPDFTRPLASLGIGQAWGVGANDAFRWELRADQSFGNSTLPNAGLTNVQALLGYAWGVGAPLDSDGDGVTDRSDQCPNTPRGADVDARGCPLDTDGDGVFDGLDRCPATPAGVKVGVDGCPLDSDGDGIPDHRDQCPTVAAPGSADGCPPRAAAEPVMPEAVEPAPAEPLPAPEPEPEPAQPLTLEGVTFGVDSAELNAESRAVLDAAAAMLQQWGGARVEVAGHTDPTGSAAYNLRLSQRRAEAVRDYLVERGVAAERLTAKGYGESMPVADNDSAAGRARNRRVELIPQQ